MPLNAIPSALNPFRRNAHDLDAGLVLSGGGARAAYQVGVLQYIGETFPEAHFSIVNGVSAGAINSTHIANHVGPLSDAVETLTQNWKELDTSRVYSLKPKLNAIRMLMAPPDEEDDDLHQIQKRHGLVDTSPLRTFLRERFSAEDGVLRGIDRNLARGVLKACAITTTNYSTGQTITWIEGKGIEDWERPNRVGRYTDLNVEHVLASTALPLFFPAIHIDGEWYGDGGIRLAAPLAPAIHLGARRILAVTTRYDRSRSEADEPLTTGYPPTAQFLGILSNAIFLDALDQDGLMLERINKLIEKLPHRHRNGLRPIELLMFRPSVDLGKLAGDYQMEIPPSLRMLTWGLGSRKTKSPDYLSMLLFQQGYIRTLIEIGYEDARRKHGQIETFFAGEKMPAQGGM